MKKNNWYVITGGPGYGKTTVIKLLKKRGFFVAHEIARAYYESQIALGFTSLELRSSPQKLQDSIARGMVDLEKSLNPEATIFLDRAIPDNYAYYKFFGVSVPHFLQRAYDSCHYKKVFFLEGIPLKTDMVRIETEEEAEYVSGLIYKDYKTKDFEIIRVPVMDENARVDFILKRL